MRARSLVVWAVILLVFMPALLLTVVRLVQADSARVLQLQAFTPLGLPLFVATLLLVVVALAFGPSDRAPLMVPAVFGAVGLFLHCFWFAPLVLGETPAPAKGAEPLVVMSANISAGEGDVVDLLAQARRVRAEVLVVTEIVPRALRDLERVGLDETFPHRLGSPGRDTGSVDGTMVFTREPAQEVRRLDTSYGSYAFTVRGLTVLAVHCAPPSDPRTWRRDHRQVASTVESLEPALILGDLNATVSHEPVRELADAGYRDVVELANLGWQPTWPSGGRYAALGLLTPLARLDLVLLSPELTAVGSDTLDVDGADHRAVVAEVVRRG